MSSRHLDKLVNFGAVVALAASHLDTLHLTRNSVERMQQCLVVAIDHDACEMRVGPQVHVKHQGILGRVPCLKIRKSLYDTPAARHDRPTPCGSIHALSRSAQSLAVHAVVLVLLHEVVVMPNLNVVPKRRARPDIGDTLD